MILYNVIVYVFQILALPMSIITTGIRHSQGTTQPSVSALHWEPTLMAVLIITGPSTTVLQELYGANTLTSAFLRNVSTL